MGVNSLFFHVMYNSKSTLLCTLDNGHSFQIKIDEYLHHVMYVFSKTCIDLTKNLKMLMPFKIHYYQILSLVGIAWEY